ncbi:MAG: hypothetical protein IJV25_03715 [Prevotella sp.]|nr:hypothetical protein [Prevotella sp.]
MKKTILTLMMVIAAVTAQADDYDYPYLTFETTDGTVQTISVISLTIKIADGNLVATNGEGTQTFSLKDLSKMYFSSEGTTAIHSIDNGQLTMDSEVYDLQGHRVTKDQMRRGVYIVKSKERTYKMIVK